MRNVHFCFALLFHAPPKFNQTATFLLCDILHGYDNSHSSQRENGGVHHNFTLQKMLKKTIKILLYMGPNVLRIEGYNYRNFTSQNKIVQRIVGPNVYK